VRCWAAPVRGRLPLKPFAQRGFSWNRTLANRCPVAQKVQAVAFAGSQPKPGIANKSLVCSIFPLFFPMAYNLHSGFMPAALGPRLGWQLLSWTPNEPAVVVPKPKRSVLPILVVLFLLSWGLMAVLVVEQGRIIDSQRGLIQSLFSDSNELIHLKGKIFQKQRAEAQAQAPAKNGSQAQTPSTQVSPRDNAKNSQKPGKLRKSPKLPADGESQDARRTVWTI